MPHCRSACYSCVFVIVLPIVGCRPGGVSAPPVDPVVAADAAIAELDKDGDGALDRTELAASPPLLAAQAEYDTSGDKKTDRDELVLRLKAMYEEEVGLTPANCTVTLDRKPLEGAAVWYIPEAYLGEGTTQRAGGITNKSGRASLSLRPDDLPEGFRKYAMMQVGLYRVEITHRTKKIPERYNKKTILGFEVHPMAHDGQDATFHLKSK